MKLRGHAGSPAATLAAVIFYRPGEHLSEQLAHDPFKAIVGPRPIGWVSTLSALKKL
jgi:hypothetical protein